MIQTFNITFVFFTPIVSNISKNTAIWSLQQIVAKSNMNKKKLLSTSLFFVTFTVNQRYIDFFNMFSKTITINVIKLEFTI